MLSGMDIDSSDEQNENVAASIVFTPFGIVIDLRAVHSSNAPLPILFTLLGIFIDSRDEQRLNE